MFRSRCAAKVLGIAVAGGAVIGATFAFFMVLASLRILPSAMPTIESWSGSISVSLIASIVGGVAGALTGGGAWSVATVSLMLVDLRPQALAVRAFAVGAGSAVGAALVLWFIASRPGVIVGVDAIAFISVSAATLAVGALLVSDRHARRSTA